jgi:hypothetical protein
VTTLPGAGRVQGVSCAEVKAGTAIRHRAAAEYTRTINNGRDTPEIGMSVAVNRPSSDGGSPEAHHLTKSSRKIWAFDEQEMNECQHRIHRPSVKAGIALNDAESLKSAVAGLGTFTGSCVHHP